MEFTAPTKFGSGSLTVTFHRPNRYAVSGQAYWLVLKDPKETFPEFLAGHIICCPQVGYQLSRTYTKRGGHPIKTITIKSIRHLRFRYPQRLTHAEALLNRLRICQLWNHQVPQVMERLSDAECDFIVANPLLAATEDYAPLKRQRLKTGIDWLIEVVDYRMERGQQPTYDALEHLDELYDWRTKHGHTLIPASLVKREHLSLLVDGQYMAPVDQQQQHCYVLAKDHRICRRIVKLLGEIQARATQLGDLGSGEGDGEDDTEIELDELQQRAIDHVASSEGWLTVINGGPGTGKTEVARQLFNRYRGLGMGFLIFMGTMAQEIRKRLGIAKGGREVSTIHYAWHARPKEITQARIIIIDEFSNVNSSLFLMALEAAPLACRLVILQDLNQIPPIKPGSPALALTQAYQPQGRCFTLTKNFRVDTGAQMIAEINYWILHHSPHLVLQTLKVVDAARLVDWPRWRKLPDRKDENPNEGVTGRFIAESFSTDLVTLRDLESWQVMTFTNKNVDEYNAAIEQYLIQRGILPLAQNHVRDVKLERGNKSPPLYLCVGAKLTATKTCRWQGDDDEKDAPNTRYDEIRNGSIFSVADIVDTPDGYEVDTTCGLKFLINPALHVSPADLRPAYCVTVCRALGSEWDHAMVLVPPNTDARFWTCEYLYVACSRAKRSLRVVGWKSDIHTMVATVGESRRTYLRELLAQHQE